VSWVSICDVAQPGLVRPSRPWCPLPSPYARPLPLPNPFVSFDFSHVVTSLSLFHLSLSPRGALGFGVKIAGIWIPEGEFSPPLPFSLPPPPPFFPWTCPSPVLVARAPGGSRPVAPPSHPAPCALAAGEPLPGEPCPGPAPAAPLAACPPLPRRASWRRLGRAASRAWPWPRTQPRALPSASRAPVSSAAGAPPLPARLRPRRALPASRPPRPRRAPPL
jgi:hypothetical protein